MMKSSVSYFMGRLPKQANNDSYEVLKMNIALKHLHIDNIVLHLLIPF